MRCQLSNRGPRDCGLTNKLSMVVNVTVLKLLLTVLKLLLSCQDCPRDCVNSEIQDIILTVTKSEKIKYS